MKEYLVVTTSDVNDGDDVETTFKATKEQVDNIRELLNKIPKNTDIRFEETRILNQLKKLLTVEEMEALHDLSYVSWELSHGYYELRSVKVYKIVDEERLF